MKCLQKIKEALLTVIEKGKLFHLEAQKAEYPYCVWTEDGAGNQLNGDNYMLQQAVQGTIDYYTQDEYDPAVNEIQEALKAARISFYLNSVQYEDETKATHWEWVFEVS